MPDKEAKNFDDAFDEFLYAMDTYHERMTGFQEYRDQLYRDNEYIGFGDDNPRNYAAREIGQLKAAFQRAVVASLEPLKSPEARNE